MSDDAEYRSWLAAVNNGREADLDGYARWSRYDSNLAYRLEPGAMENLLDAAVERVQELEALRLADQGVIAHETQMREDAESRATALSETRTRLLAKHPHELCKFQREEVEAERDHYKRIWGAWADRAISEGMKLAEVRALAVQWSEEAGDYVPPLAPDEPYNLMVNHSAALLKIVGQKP